MLESIASQHRKLARSRRAPTGRRRQRRSHGGSIRGGEEAIADDRNGRANISRSCARARQNGHVLDAGHLGLRHIGRNRRAGVHGVLPGGRFNIASTSVRESVAVTENRRERRLPTASVAGGLSVRRVRPRPPPAGRRRPASRPPCPTRSACHGARARRGSTSTGHRRPAVALLERHRVRRRVVVGQSRHLEDLGRDDALVRDDLAVLTMEGDLGSVRRDHRVDATHRRPVGRSRPRSPRRASHSTSA